MEGKGSIKLIDGVFSYACLGHWHDTGRAIKLEACETAAMTKAVTDTEITACN